MIKLNQYDSFELLVDINPNIQKGMIGVVLEIYDSLDDYEVEFIKSDGTNFDYNGECTFTLNRKDIKPLKL